MFDGHLEMSKLSPIISDVFRSLVPDVSSTLFSLITVELMCSFWFSARFFFAAAEEDTLNPNFWNKEIH